MNAALVKIDVAAVDLHRGIPDIHCMVDGGDMLLPGLVFVFNVARNLESRDRELRFWRTELQALQFDPPHNKFKNSAIESIVKRILPERIENFQAGQVDELFQLRPRTRIDLHQEICGRMISGRHSYSRDILADFLTRRWINRQPAGGVLGKELVTK